MRKSIQWIIAADVEHENIICDWALTKKRGFQMQDDYINIMHSNIKCKLCGECTYEEDVHKAQWSLNTTCNKL